MKRAWQFGISIVPVLLLAMAASLVTADEPATTKQDEAAQQIKALIEGDAFQRRDATSKLLELGKDAVEPLAKEAAEAKPTAMYHCFDVLARLLASENEATSTAAKTALDKLTESENKSVALRAKSVIRLKEILGRRQAAIPAVAALPAQGPMKLSSNENGRTIELERAADGSFSGKIKESVNGEEKSTDIKAADAKELEQKFPDAYKALQKHEEQIRNAQQNAQRAANPFGGGAFNANIMINGVAGGQRTSVKVVNGNRTIEVQSGDEKIEIRDKNGKEIELKHTRPVDGKAKTDEYKGADLDDLRKKHPEAAKLYEKHAPANGIVGGAAAQIQIQAVPGVFRGANGLRLTPTEFGPISPGPRTIRADLEDRKIEITDDDGHKIRVKTTKTVDGKETTEEFAADDLKELKAEHPDIAKLYEKYTGTKAE